MDTNNIFHTPGIYYRPAELKSMSALWGNSESRKIYQNFQLNNLNSNAPDYTHEIYHKYLQLHHFLPPGNKTYFAHTMNNHIPSVPSLTRDKGLFNLFPLDLSYDFNRQLSDKNKNSSDGGTITNTTTTTTSRGVVSTSPLKLEIEFSPVPTNTWFLLYVFVYLNTIAFSGQKNKQDVMIE